MRRFTHLFRGRRPAAIAALALLLVLVAGCGDDDDGDATAAAGETPADGDSAKVAIFSIASDTLLEDLVAGFKEEFLAETGLAPEQVEWVEENAQGDPGLIQGIARTLADDDSLDMIVALGTPVVMAVAENETETPIIAVAMGDPVGAGVAESLDEPGGNVTGSIDYVDPADILAQLEKVEPAPTSIGTIYDPSNQNMQVWVGALEEAVAEAGVQLETASIAAAADVSAAARSLKGKVDALLIGPDALVITGLPAVSEAAVDAGQGIYLVGGDPTTPGVVATLGPDYPELGRSAGAVAAEVHAGADPGSVPFGRPGSIEWGVNAATVAELQLTLPAEASS
jgi:putative ABC transport system substrate-binding protein